MYTIQTNFQAVLVTDGSTSFLILNYEDYVAVIDSFDNSGIPYQSGMDAGDTIRSTQIRRSGNDTEFFFRIDGKLLLFFFQLVGRLKFGLVSYTVR